MAVIRATDDSDSVTGTSGRDVLQGDEDDNYLDGMAGRDWVFGNGGNDILIFDNADQMLHGGEGFDTLRFLTGNQTANLAEKPVINSIEAIDFASSGNRLTLTAADIERISDNDALVITGGAGNTVDAGTGWHYDGRSADSNFYAFSQGSIHMSVATGIQLAGFTPPPPPPPEELAIYGTAGNDLLVIAVDGYKVYGLAGNDTLRVSLSSIYYQLGVELYGGDDDDVLIVFGKAVLDGGAGNDTLFWITNTDDVIATGGSGADKFNLSVGGTRGNHLITDFNPLLEGDTLFFSDPEILTSSQFTVSSTTDVDGIEKYTLYYDPTPGDSADTVTLVTLVGENLTPAVIVGAITFGF